MEKKKNLLFAYQEPGEFSEHSEYEEEARPSEEKPRLMLPEYLIRPFLSGFIKKRSPAPISRARFLTRLYLERRNAERMDMREE